MREFVLLLVGWAAGVSLGVGQETPNAFKDKDRLDRTDSLAVLARAGLLEATLKIEENRNGEMEAYRWSDVFAITRRGIEFNDRERGLVGVPTAKIDSRTLVKLGFKADDLTQFYNELEAAVDASVLWNDAERERRQREAEAHRWKAFVEKHRIPVIMRISQRSDDGALGTVQPKRLRTRMKTVSALGHQEPRRVWVAGPSTLGFIEGDFSKYLDGDTVSMWVIPYGTYEHTTGLSDTRTLSKYLMVDAP